MIGEEHMNNLQSIINDFLNNMNAYEDNILEAIAHLIDVELKERDFLKNPQNFSFGMQEVMIMKIELKVGDLVRFSTEPSVRIRGMTDNIGNTAVVSEVKDELLWFWKEDVDPLGNDMFRGPTVVVQIGDKQKLVLTDVLEKVES
jgi:hypothetical protein